MPSFVLDKRTKFLIVVALLVLWIAALPNLPLMQPWGLDLHNVQAFEQCTAGRSPYRVDAHACGDVLDRPFWYPPFLFASFAWLRPFKLATAMYIWTVFMLVSFAGIFYVWAKKVAGETPPRGERHQVVTVCVLLLFQYPFVFALERGNTDVMGVLFYTLAAYLFVRKKVWLAGMAAGVSAAFKLSPIIAVIVMTGALGWAWRSAGRWTWLRFSGGALTAFALSLLIFFGDSRIYLFEVLPKWAYSLSFASEYGHSLPAYVGDSYRNYAGFMGVCLLVPWMWGGGEAIARGNVAFPLAGSLAVSTYLQGTSFDYNLISAYPLLLLLFLRAQRIDRWALLVFGLFAIVGDRRLFSLPGAKLLTPQLHLTLQLAFLVVTALAIARPEDARPEAARPEGARLT